MPDPKPKAPEPIKNPTPKQRFLQNTRAVKDYVAILDSESFNTATDLAMLEYQQTLARQTTDALTASAAGFKLKGALEFLQLLKTLPDTHPVTARRDFDNLHEPPLNR